MAEEFANKIKRLELENFTCFGKVAMDFSPGINVFIGENGTGKTHLLKVLYATIFQSYKNVEPDDFWREVAAKYNSVYKSKATYDLVRNQSKSSTDTNSIEIDFGETSQHFGVGKSLMMGDPLTNHTWGKPISFVVKYPPIFIPVQEMLSWFEGFIPAYEHRETSIEETYYDLAKALEPYPLKGDAFDKQNKLLVDLEKGINAKVIRKGNEFLLSFNEDNKELNSHLVATGINKLAQLIYLIMNGSLTKDTILFWDEPEANLNPKYILVVSKFLQTLAKAGCQIFVATHDYLLPYDLSLSKEYQDVEGGAPDMKFFSLFKGENGTEVEEGATMPDLNHDPIHEGLSQHNNREDALFRKSLNPQA